MKLKYYHAHVVIDPFLCINKFPPLIYLSLHYSYTGLPLEIGFLVNLTKLHLQKNKIRELPEGLGKLLRLEIIDVAANELKIFPTEVKNIV